MSYICIKTNYIIILAKEKNLGGPPQTWAPGIEASKSGPDNKKNLFEIFEIKKVGT
jgi:hypothetical protein